MLNVHSDGEGCGATFSLELPLFRTPDGYLLNPETSEFESAETVANQISTNISSTISSKVTRRYPLRCRKQKSSQISDSMPGTQSPGHLKNRFEDISAGSISWPTSESIMTPRFLVVDDSSVNRKIMRRILQSDATRFPTAIIDEVNDGDVAITMVAEATQSKAPYNAILMDSVMNKLNGLAAALYIRKELKYEGVIIIVTGIHITHYLAR